MFKNGLTASAALGAYIGFLLAAEWAVNKTAELLGPYGAMPLWCVAGGITAVIWICIILQLYYKKS